MANNKADLALIVGLGNVGAKYDHTRHNMGVDLLNLIADAYKINLVPESKFAGLVGRGTIERHDVRLAFPTTFMNESGRCVGALCTFYRIAPEQVLVLHDEMDLNPGAIRLKFLALENWHWQRSRRGDKSCALPSRSSRSRLN